MRPGWGRRTPSPGAGPSAAGDVVALHGFGSLTFDSLIFVDTTDGTLLDLGGGDQITFADVTQGELNQEDFLCYA